MLLQVAVVLVRRVLGRAEQRKQCQGQLETLERLRGVKEQVQEEDDAFIAEVGDFKRCCRTVSPVTTGLKQSVSGLSGFSYWNELCDGCFKVAIINRQSSSVSILYLCFFFFALNAGLRCASAIQRSSEEDREGAQQVEERPTVVYI